MGNVWDAEMVVSPFMAKQLIEGQFPELAPGEVNEIGRGFDNTVYSVNGKYIFRFPRRAIAVPLLKTENKLLPPLAEKMPLPIATPCYFGSPVPNLYPWPFTGYYLIPGKPPGCLSHAERITSAVPLGRFLRALHAFPAEQAKSLQVPYDELDRLGVENRRPKLLGFLNEIRDLQLYERVDNLEQIVQDTEPHETAGHEVLVHGDLHIRNITVDANGKVSGIIDWGDVHIGHPAVDLSIVYSFLPPEGREMFFHVYGEIDLQTQELARFKALYTTVLLMLYGHGHQDAELIKAAGQSLNLLRL
ncbi:Phosphotransferase enzyme family protein [Bacillus sp. OV194]|nr:Phosphotransferase enzyme family protein [Bacillus sp. OV194]